LSEVFVDKVYDKVGDNDPSIRTGIELGLSGDDFSQRC
jgi:hypothetical protein